MSRGAVTLFFGAVLVFALYLIKYVCRHREGISMVETANGSVGDSVELDVDGTLTFDRSEEGAQIQASEKK